jgi:hypothetical protein
VPAHFGRFLLRALDVDSDPQVGFLCSRLANVLSLLCQFFQASMAGALNLCAHAFSLEALLRV